MYLYYYMSDIAVIGGSFKDYGGQNLIEALFLNKPVIFGQFMYNFKTIADNALKNDCAIQVINMEDCFNQIQILLNDINKYNKMVMKSSIFVEHYQGASEKVMTVIKEYL